MDKQIVGPNSSINQSTYPWGRKQTYIPPTNAIPTHPRTHLEQRSRGIHGHGDAPARAPCLHSVDAQLPVRPVGSEEEIACFGPLCWEGMEHVMSVRASLKGMHACNRSDQSTWTRTHHPSPARAGRAGCTPFAPACLVGLESCPPMLRHPSSCSPLLFCLFVEGFG